MEAEARPGREGEPHGDDSLMERFDRWDLRRFSAWDAVKAVALTTLLLLIFAGGAVRKAADELKPGLGRDIVKAIGGPAGWVADQLPFAETRRDLTVLALARPAAHRARLPGPAAASRLRRDRPAAGAEHAAAAPHACSSPATRSPPRSTSRSPASSPTRAPECK